jgi:hypothetical protein
MWDICGCGMQPADYHAFAQALQNPAMPSPAGLQAPPDTDLAERFAVYRNNVHVSLIDALAEKFAVTRALVGEEFFRAMARSYVVEHKPASPVLACYGEDFPDFIDACDCATALPFLGDVARLEREWSNSWAAADEPALDRSGLARFSAAQLAAAYIRPHAAARLLRSAWPVADLWQAHQQPDPDLSSLQWQPQDVLITRPDAEIQLQRIDAGAAAIAQALFSGRSIAESAAHTESIDMGAALGLFLDSGMIAEVVPA